MNRQAAMLAAHREECARMIVLAARREAKLAWYYTYCGALEFARDADIISEFEYTALANSWEDYGRATIERGAQR